MVVQRQAVRIELASDVIICQFLTIGCDDGALSTYAVGRRGSTHSLIP